MGRPRLSNFIMLKAKTVMGKQLKPGQRVPAGLVSAAKLKQLENWSIVANVGEAVGQEKAEKYQHRFDSDVSAK